MLNRARELGAEVRMKREMSGRPTQSPHHRGTPGQINRQALQLIGAPRSRGAAPPLEENLQRVEVNRLDASRQTPPEPGGGRTRSSSKCSSVARPEAPLSVHGDLRTRGSVTLAQRGGT